MPTYWSKFAFFDTTNNLGTRNYQIIKPTLSAPSRVVFVGKLSEGNEIDML